MTVDERAELSLVELIELDDRADPDALEAAVETPDKNVVFISYRRRYRAEAELLRRRLARRYGAKRVFIDSSVPGGALWRDLLEEQLDQTKIMVVIVGPQWADEFATRSRLGKPDWSRWELLAAQASDTAVVPVCVSGASLPDAESLPPDLRWVTDSQAVVVHPDHLGAGHRAVCRATDKAMGLWARQLFRLVLFGLVACGLIAIAALVYSALQSRKLPVFDDAERVVLFAPGAETATETVPPIETAFAHDFVVDVADELASELGGDVTVHILDPSQAEFATESSQEVKRILSTTNADLLIAGHLERRSNHSDYLPELFVGQVDGLEELFGEAVSFAADDVRRRDQDIADASAIRAALIENAATALVPSGQLLAAMDAVSLREPTLTDTSMSALLDGREALLDADAWPLYVLRANARLALGDLDGARSDFDAAVELDPSAGRPKLGLAEVDVSLAIDAGCVSSGAVLIWLDDAEVGFEAVRATAEVAPDLGLVVKAAVGQGRVDMCRSRSLAVSSVRAQLAFAASGLAHIDAARAAFGAIEQPETTVAETMAVGLIAAAETRIATASLGADAGVDSTAELEAAIDALAETSGGAISISTRAVTKARAWSVLSNAYNDLGDSANAVLAGQEACASLAAADPLDEGVASMKQAIGCE